MTNENESQKNQPPVEKNPMYEAAFKKMRQRSAARKWFRRGGCLVIFIIWLGLMLLPCFFITLLVEKEIIISRSDVPEHEYRFFLLEQPDEQGIGISRARIISGGEDEDAVCVVTSVSYYLWEGEGDNSTYCNCYEKSGDSWSPTLIGGDADCKPVDFSADENTDE